MPNRYKLFTTLLPIAAIGFLVAEDLATADYMRAPASIVGATTLDATAPGRGARSDYAWLRETSIAMAADATAEMGHPRRPETRSLPQPANGLALADQAPHDFTSRGARG